MNKIIFLIITIALLSGCDIVTENSQHDPLQDIKIGQMDNYNFENNIEINWLGNAMLWSYYNLTYIPDDTDYWQLPEETYKLKTGDCEDYCIMFMFLLKTKLNIETNLIMIENNNNEIHTIVYPVPFGPDAKPMYYEVVNNNLSSTLQDGWHIKFSIPYPEVMWMTYNYHNNVGIYY